MSNYASPPIGSAPYGGVSPYRQAPAAIIPGGGNTSTYPGMTNPGGAAGIGAGGGTGAVNGYPLQQQQQASYHQSSYPGMVSQLQPSAQAQQHQLLQQQQQQQQMQMQMQQAGYGTLSGRVSPALTGTTAVASTPHGVTLMKDQVQQQHPFAAPPGASISPGTVTYTITKDASGRPTYHHFKAEPATYHSPQGVTYTGIQWVGCGSSSVPPPGAAPAGADFPVMNNGGSGNYGDDYRDDTRAYRDWEKEEHKRRKKEEKEANKRAAHWEHQQRMREKAEEKEYRRAQQQQVRLQDDPEIMAARERDSMRERELQHRSRRLSTASRPGADGLGAVVPGAGIYGDAPRQGSGVYDTGISRERERSVYGSLGPDAERDLEQRMGDMRVGGGGGPMSRPGSRLTTDFVPPPAGVRSRRSSMSMMPVPTVGGSPLPGAAVPPGGGVMPGGRGKMYDDTEYIDRDYDREDYSLGPTTTRSRRGSMHVAGRGAPSPYRSSSPLPPVMNNAGVPVYPPGHVYEGEPYHGAVASGALSRSHSPIPGTAPYPSSMSNPSNAAAYGPVGASAGGFGVVPRTPRHVSDPLSDRELLATPDAFSRPLNRAQSFTPFETMEVQELEDFLRVIPKFPAVLSTHDVYAEEWGRLMGDLSLACQGRIPLPAQFTGRTPKRTDLVADLLDSWNYAFFLPRGVEIALYKGRERLSGRGAGRPETRLPRMDSEDSYSSASSDDDDFYSDAEPERGGRLGHYGIYGRRDERFEQEMRESRLFRRQNKEEKRRLARERQTRKDMRKTYALYMCYVETAGREPYGRGGGGGGGSNYGGSQVGGYAGPGYASSGHGL